MLPFKAIRRSLPPRSCRSGDQLLEQAPPHPSKHASSIGNVISTSSIISDLSETSMDEAADDEDLNRSQLSSVFTRFSLSTTRATDDGFSQRSGLDQPRNIVVDDTEVATFTTTTSSCSSNSKKDLKENEEIEEDITTRQQPRDWVAVLALSWLSEALTGSVSLPGVLGGKSAFAGSKTDRADRRALLALIKQGSLVWTRKNGCERPPGRQTRQKPSSCEEDSIRMYIRSLKVATDALHGSTESAAIRNKFTVNGLCGLESRRDPIGEVDGDLCDDPSLSDESLARICLSLLVARLCVDSSSRDRHKKVLASHDRKRDRLSTRNRLSQPAETHIESVVHDDDCKSNAQITSTTTPSITVDSQGKGKLNADPHADEPRVGSHSHYFYFV